MRHIWKVVRFKHIIYWVSLIAVLVLIDQLSKIYIVKRFEVQPAKIEVFPFLDVNFILNNGVSFGFLTGLDYRLILFISICALSLITYVVLKNFLVINYRIVFGISLLWAGSIGNIIDRSYYKGVVDFISIHFKTYYFPVFNIADCMITLCVFLLALEIIIHEKVKKSNDKK